MYDQILKVLRRELQKALENSTQEEVAHLCDITQPTIQRIIKGTRGQNLPLKTVLNIAYGLHLNIHKLFNQYPPISQAEKLKILLAELNDLISAGNNT